MQKSGCLLQLAELIPRQTNKLNIKKDLSGGTPCKIMVVVFSYAVFVGLPKEAKSG